MAVDQGTIIDGAARSDNVNASGLVIDMESRIKELEPDSYMMVALTKAFGAKVAADQLKHEYMERRPIPNYSVCSAAVSAGDAAISVKDYDRCKTDHLIYVPKNDEMYLIQDAAIDESVAVVAWPAGSGTIVTAIAVGDPLVIMQVDAHADGEAVPTAFTNQSTNKFDYIMQLDRAVKKTDIEAKSKHYDTREDTLAFDRGVAWIEAMRDINVLMYVGKAGREIVTASGRRRHCLGGVFEKFTENDIDLSESGGGFTEETLSSILAETTFFSASSKTKVGLFGTKAWRAISAWPKAALRISPNAKEWGVRVSRIITGFGDVDVGYDNVLNADKGLDDRGVILDQNKMRQLYLAGLPVRLYTGIQGSRDIHNTEDAISGTVGIMTPLAELYAQISGVA
ncbi:hypothetical protein D4R42_01425 [bacterium]|nr:MAG: hypothetical protein D4R42_01425 [bacterium]